MSEISGGIHYQDGKCFVRGRTVIRMFEEMDRARFRSIISRGTAGKAVNSRPIPAGGDQYVWMPGKPRIPFRVFTEDDKGTEFKLKETNLFNEEMKFSHRRAREENETESADYDFLCASLWYDSTEVLAMPEFDSIRLSLIGEATIRKVKQCVRDGKRPTVTKKWDTLADVKRKNPTMTARQLREDRNVIAAFGDPPKEDHIRRKLKKDYGLSFS